MFLACISKFQSVVDLDLDLIHDPSVKIFNSDEHLFALLFSTEQV